MELDPVKNPEYFSTETRGHLYIGLAAFLMTAATTAVALRFYTRRILLNQLGFDDWLSFVALFFTIATGVAQCWLTRNGLGHHIGTLPQPDGFKAYMLNFWIVIVFYNTSIMFVKLTFLAQYYRVLAIQKMRRVCFVAMVVIGSWSFSQLMIAIFICVPVAGFWDQSLGAKCIPTLPEWYQNAAGNIATDIAIFVIPLPALSNLNLPKTQKQVPFEPPSLDTCFSRIVNAL
ncbi:uncharacterized protein BCR38DRAFT_487261 [Pseudomassariella vexata]|uniref:Rhodopsin domain-containing protein n=1 Tax=Pseudomassariella vexata TaxID=1141098 RepID=A0A1Y2DQD9_9PEZI|nr:uncharacterized protein BCR38DRAFT_487261 [Pseudomassariella vexata]ORY61508.1 hypothetical protein BCR38DRAFT_487261 [Pseudomassariella vexata]